MMYFNVYSPPLHAVAVSCLVYIQAVKRRYYLAQVKQVFAAVHWVGVLVSCANPTTQSYIISLEPYCLRNNFLTLHRKNTACRACDGGDTDSPLTPPLSPAFGGSNPEGWQPVATEVSRTAEVNINSLWFRHSTCAPGRLGKWGQRRALRRVLTSDVWRVSNSQAIP